MLNDVADNLTKPWREPMSLVDVLLWIVLFLIFAYGLHDMIRILSSYVKHYT